MTKHADRLGHKPPPSATAAGGLRESFHDMRTAALTEAIAALRGLTPTERTNVIAAVAEFYGLSLTVEN